MNKLVWLGVLVVISATLYASYASAAITGCASPRAYIDTGVEKNVSVGNVCINATSYDVDPTTNVKCGEWYDYVAGACNVSSYFVGYNGTNTSACSDTGWVLDVAGAYVAQGYIVNVTAHAAATPAYTVNVGKTATYSGCTNLYTRNGTTGYCEGDNTLQKGTLHVAAGDVCHGAGTNVAPNATYKCGTWSNCVKGATTADEYWVGYAASGTACSDTNWVAAGSTQTSTYQAWLTTGHFDTCAGQGYVPSYVKGDLQNVVVDGLGTAGAETVSWLDMIVLVLVLGFIVGIALKFGKSAK